MIRGIIFDFDGLIVDTESVWFTVYADVLKDYQIELTLNEFSKCIGTSDDVLFKMLQSKTEIELNQQEIKKKTEQLYQLRMEELALREGVLDYLQAAKRLGLRIGLASSSSRQWVVGFLEKFNILSYFEVIKTKEDVQKVKPDPALYSQALEGLNLESEEVIVFEDSLNGLIAATKVNLACIIVPNPVTRELAFSGHAHRLQSMEEQTLEEVIRVVTTKQKVL
ncbi:HAD family hydrolase [Bacillus spongiae]|uniref:HAD family hydrolase n=1 Tax=Bacillus spongiae TaxID=2683610 RepID=A0ABU8HB46_9BACI